MAFHDKLGRFAGGFPDILTGDRSFEKSILDEVGIFGRGLYGTGLRA